MRMKIESVDAMQQAEHVEGTVDLGRRRSPVGSRSGPQAEAIVDRHAEPGKQRPREATKPLPRGNSVIAMVQIFDDLSIDTFLSRRVVGFADVVMGTDEDQMIGIVEEPPDGLDLHGSGLLPGPERIEADDDKGIDALNQGIVERRLEAAIVDTFDLDDTIARQLFGELGEGKEVRFLNVIEKSGDTLLDMVSIRQTLEFRIENPSQLENRRKAIFDDREWRASLLRPGSRRNREGPAVRTYEIRYTGPLLLVNIDELSPPL